MNAFNCTTILNYRKDVSLPTQLQRAMATEAEASRDGKFFFSLNIKLERIESQLKHMVISSACQSNCC